MNTATNVQTIASTPKPLTSKEAIQANVDLLIERSEARGADRVHRPMKGGEPHASAQTHVEAR